MDPVLLLHFNGSVRDTGSANHVLRVAGSASFDTSNFQFGSASLLCPNADGSGVEAVPNRDFALGTGDYTVELWYRKNVDVNARTIIYMRVTNEFGPELSVFSPDAIHYVIRHFSGGILRIESTTLLTLGDWHNIALCRASGVTRLFVDGVQEGGNYADTNNYGTGYESLRVGFSLKNTPGGQANIDELRITREAFYTANFTPAVAEFSDAGPTEHRSSGLDAEANWSFNFVIPDIHQFASVSLPANQVINLVPGQTSFFFSFSLDDTCDVAFPTAVGGAGIDQVAIAPITVGPIIPGWHHPTVGDFANDRVSEPIVAGNPAVMHLAGCAGEIVFDVFDLTGVADQYLYIRTTPLGESPPVGDGWVAGMAPDQEPPVVVGSDCGSGTELFALYFHDYHFPATRLLHSTATGWQSAGGAGGVAIFREIAGVCTQVLIFSHQFGNDGTLYYQGGESSLLPGDPHAFFNGEAFFIADGTFLGAKPCLGPGALTEAMLEQAESLSSRPVAFLVLEFNTGCTFVGGWDMIIPNLEGKDRKIYGWVLDWGQMNDSIQKTLEDSPILAGLWTVKFMVPGGRTGEDTIWTRINDPRNLPELTRCSLFVWFRDLDPTTDPPYKRWEGTVNVHKWLSEDELEVEFSDSWALYDRPVGTLCTNIQPVGSGAQVGVAFFPKMALDDVGKIESILYGNGIGVPCVSIDSGPNSNLAADYLAPFLGGGPVPGIVVTDRGLGYTSAPVVKIDPPFSGVQATATAVISGGQVIAVNMTNGGSGYFASPPNPPPAVNFTGGNPIVQAAAQVKGQTELQYAIIIGQAPQFANAGKVWVDGEVFSYTSKTTRQIVSGNDFTIVGVLTGVEHAERDDFGHVGVPSSGHVRGAGILQSQQFYKYSVAGHPIQRVSTVYASEVQVPAFLYVLNYNDAGRTTILFVLPPRVLYAVAKLIADNSLWATNAHVIQIHQQPLQVAGSGGPVFVAATGSAIAVFQAIPGLVKWTLYMSVGVVQMVFALGSHLRFWVQVGLVKTIIWDSDQAQAPGNPFTSHVEFIGPGNVLNFGIDVVSGFLFGNGAFIQFQQVQREAYVQAANTKTGAVTASALQSANPNVEPRITYNGTGWLDDTFGSITGTPYALITKTAQVIKHFMKVFLGLPTDKFEVSAGLVDKMGSTFNVNGAIMQRQYGKFWVSRWAFEAACWAKFEAGKLKLTFRETVFAPAEVITSKRLSFMGQGRQAIVEEQAPLNQIINVINLRYNRDYTMSGPSGYRSLVSVQDGLSQSRYGIKERANLFQFDFCASPIEAVPPTAADVQAETVARIYLAVYGRRRTFLKFRQRMFALGRQYGDRVVLQDRLAPTVAGEVVAVDMAPGGVPERKLPAFDITMFAIPEAIYMRNVYQKTGAYTLMSPADQGQTFSNKGATGTVNLNLPASKVGDQWGPFFVTDAFFLRLVPIATDSFVTTGQPVGTSAPSVQTAGHAIKSNTPRSILYVECFKAGEFQVLFQEGTWSVE